MNQSEYRSDGPFPRTQRTKDFSLFFFYDGSFEGVGMAGEFTEDKE